MPRPRALDEMKRREICALIAAGCDIRQAARYVQCSASTIHREAQRDPDFLESIRRAEMNAQLSPLHAMQKAVGSHWRAAAWFLERTNPDRFARRDVRAFGPKQLRALAGDLIHILHSEIPDVALSERLVRRFKAAFNYATHAAWNARQGKDDLRRAIEFFAEKDKKQEPDEFSWPDVDIDNILRNPPPFVNFSASPPKSATSTTPANKPVGQKPFLSQPTTAKPTAAKPIASQPMPGKLPHERTAQASPATAAAAPAHPAEGTSNAILGQLCADLADEIAKKAAQRENPPVQNPDVLRQKVDFPK